MFPVSLKFSVGIFSIDGDYRIYRVGNFARLGVDDPAAGCINQLADAF